MTQRWRSERALWNREMSTHKKNLCVDDESRSSPVAPPLEGSPVPDFYIQTLSLYLYIHIDVVVYVHVPT